MNKVAQKSIEQVHEWKKELEANEKVIFQYLFVGKTKYNHYNQPVITITFIVRSRFNSWWESITKWDRRFDSDGKIQPWTGT
jgi:hypothetical protein